MEVIRTRSQVFTALEQMTVHLRQKLKGLRGTVAKGSSLRETVRASQSRLRKLVEFSRDATVAANARITREVFMGLGHAAIRLEQAQSAMIRLGRTIVARHRRRQQSIRGRENELRTLLECSPDAIVVADGGRRFIEANQKGLDLFGVSEANMRKFTVDTFLPPGQIPEFERNGSPFRRRNATYGRCEIRRLDGSLRVAEYRFFANFVPFRHVYKFHNVVAMNQYRPATLRLATRTICSVKQVRS